MSTDGMALRQKVAEVLAEALDVKADQVLPHSSLIDDLGAESIDFLDVLFRLEEAFGIEIPVDELWAGSLDSRTPAALEAGVRQLRARMPDFRWDRFPERLRREDLPHLITPQTIIDYLERRGV